MAVKKATFILSLDVEIAWGWLSFLQQREALFPLFRKTKPVMLRLLDLMDQYDIPSTWAIVGRLLEEPGNKSEFASTSLKDYFPSLTNETVYGQKGIDEPNKSIVHFPELLEEIQRRKVKHDIGTHTYNHTFLQFLPEGSDELVKTDINAAVELFKNKKVEAPCSLIFPKNQMGYEQILYDAGIRIVRSPNVERFRGYPKVLNRLLNKLDLFLPTGGPAVEPERHPSGLVLVPGSQIFRISNLGSRQHIPMANMVKKCIRGIDRAVAEKKIYHLWFHPFNFAHREQEHFDALEKVFQHLNQLREQQSIEVLTLKTFYSRISHERH